MRSDSGPSSARAVVLHVRSRRTHATATTGPLLAHSSKDGVAVGREICLQDPLVSVAHGTLECTPLHGVWVFVDHSESGTLLNQKQRVHGDAVVVRDGDVLSLGHTEITLAFQGAKHRPTLDEDLNNNQRTHVLTPPPSVAAPQPLSNQLARNVLPNIYTGRGTFQPPPEHINSPAPGAYLKQKRHSFSVGTRKPVTLGVAPAVATPTLSTSQTFPRSQPRPLVPSAPTTPPQKDTASRPSVAHHVPAAVRSPQSAYYRVKFRDEEPHSPTIREEDERPLDNNTIEPTPPLIPSPPLEYSSSPQPQAAFPHRLHHTSPAKSAKPTALPGMLPGAPLSAYDSPPAKSASQRPMDLRVQVARRNAELAAGSSRSATAAAATATPTLSRGTTIPAAGPSPYKQPHNQQRRFSGAAIDMTAPASPMACRVLDNERSLTSILHEKKRQEQKLKQEQEEWMRSQFPGVPSMSPIRHHDNHGSRGHENATAAAAPSALSADNDGGMLIPAKAPALLRTVSLGVASAFQIQSPRVKQAAMASHAHRKGGFANRTQASRSSQEDAAIAQVLLQRQRSSGGDSVASSVSTEPSNHRRVTRSHSFSSSRIGSSGELSDFQGYDDDATDDLLSFTSYFNDGAEPLAPRGASQQQQLHTQQPAVAAPPPAIQPHRLIYPPLNHLRSRAPSLDDDMAGLNLNSPSAHARPQGFGFSSISCEPRSVAKPIFGRGQQS